MSNAVDRGMAVSEAGYDGFRVARWVDALGGFISRRPRLWIALGNLESRLIADDSMHTALAQPIYISGVARAGSTILLETLAQHPDLASHRYRDYPPVFTPYWWNRFLEHVPQRDSAPAERTHRDGIAITPESPEAFEEVIWMAFFPGLHDPAQSAVLPSEARHPEFEAFYRDHIRKLVRIRGGRRYLSKDNYNVSRLEYLLKLFPDARFVIPVRDPVWHIASLMKQHALFCAGERAPSRGAPPHAAGRAFRVRAGPAGDQRGRPGVPGPDHRCLGDEATRSKAGRAIGPTSMAIMADRLAANPALKRSVVGGAFRGAVPVTARDARSNACPLPARHHAGMAGAEERRDPLSRPTTSPALRPPSVATIERHTADTAARFGYPGSRPIAPARWRRASRAAPWIGARHGTSCRQRSTRLRHRAPLRRQGCG